MKKLNLKIKDMPYAAEEALNRLRVNIKFCGKNTKKIVITSSVLKEASTNVQFLYVCGSFFQRLVSPLFWWMWIYVNLKYRRSIK